MLVNAAFCVIILVVPELLKINKLPQFITIVIMYPLYNFAIDDSGTASSFAPNLSFGLGLLSESWDFSPMVSSVSGVVCGGLLGGYIMQRHFPDDQK